MPHIQNNDFQKIEYRSWDTPNISKNFETNWIVFFQIVNFIFGEFFGRNAQ